MTRRLPAGYQAREENVHFIDAPTATIHQHQIYEFLRYLVRRGSFERVIDIGCGSAEKLKGLDDLIEIICIDAAPMRDFVFANVPKAQFIDCNLENGLPDTDLFGPRTLVVCADVIEHLKRPEILLRDMARIAETCPYVLISTPDRARARGFRDVGPPRNPAHTMEWTVDELGRLLTDCGFPANLPIGYTLNNNTDLSKSTILAIAGREACYRPTADSKTVAAVITVFNEIDVIEQVVRYLGRQGVEVHLVDNWSSDGSFELAKAMQAAGLCADVVRFPAEPPKDYDWTALLQHTASYGAKLDADWVIHYDADEIRCAPWLGVTLPQALSFVDSLGYTAIDFTVLNFGFTQPAGSGPVALGDLKFFDFGRHPAHQLQIKAWKNQGQVVDLASSGGHIAKFPQLKVYPLKFLTRHYPMRSVEQASKKVFQDRLPRVERERREKNWHGHYDIFQNMRSIQPWREFELINFDDHVFAGEFLIERLSGIGIETELRAIPNLNTIFEVLNAVGMPDADQTARINQLAADRQTLIEMIAHARIKIDTLEKENSALRARPAPPPPGAMTQNGLLTLARQ